MHVGNPASFDAKTEERMSDSEKIVVPKRLSCAAARRSRGRVSAGFSLAEALAAIVIAALLAVVLTRVANNTRMNAGKIQELVSMMGLNGALLAQVAPKELGTTHGRAGMFHWHIDVAPLNFVATARRMNKEPSDSDTSSRTAVGLADFSDISAQIKKPEPAVTTKWLPVYVTVVVDSPSGRRYSFDTISIAPEPKENARSRISD
jgi:hypothetical protein